jgi:outer membrane protein assembly factor BamB
MKRAVISWIPVILFITGSLAPGADWNQWRGPNRNGVATDDTPLATEWPEEGLTLLWESEAIPSDHYGGHGSAVVAGGKVYLSLVWHRDVPTETRAIDGRVMSTLGSRGNDFSPELRAKAEEARLNHSARLRGEALKSWAMAWVDENLDETQQLKLGSWMASRIIKGKSALSFDDFDRLEKVKKERFESYEAMVMWLEGEDFSESVREQIIAAVPNTRLAAEDVVMCLDAETGETLWKKSFPSEETGRSASSTPSVVDGKVFAVSRESLYCLDAENGNLLWKSPLPAIGPASCPLVFDGKVVFQGDSLVAYSFESGKLLWEQKEVGGRNASPTSWEVGGRRVIVANSKKGCFLVDADSGDVVGQVGGGGEASPVVSGEYLVVYGGGDDGGLFGYRWDDASGVPEEIWKHTWRSRRKHSTPIVYEGHVYLTGGDKHLCVELESGEKRWEEMRKSNISSPILVDGKILTLQNNGSSILMLEASPEAYTELARAKLKALACPTPAVADGRIFLRLSDRLVCFDLRGG